jgi:hypothetical protein
MPETMDMKGGKSIDDDIPTNKIKASSAIPRIKGKLAEGQGLQTKLSM